MHALVFDRFGGPEVLEYRELPDPAIPAGHLQLEVQAAGLNFADVYRRNGNYHLAGDPPYICGYEGAGRVVGIGEGVSGYAIGERIAFADVPFAHATRVNVPVEHAIPLPEGISCELAAAVLLQGLTAQYLVSDSYAVQRGDVVLVHAAAGGVGQYLTQMAVARGAEVIALVSSEDKCRLAKSRGAQHAILNTGPWLDTVREISRGGVHVTYDSIGATLEDSFRATRAKGTVVFFGMAGGNPPLVDPRTLMDHSQHLVGGDLWSYLDSKASRLQRAADLFALLIAGKLTAPEIERFDLKDGANAYRRLESRKLMGKIILVSGA
ncbi:MAG: quinone oxidoreductase [Pseudomonadota bacterium]